MLLIFCFLLLAWLSCRHWCYWFGYCVGLIRVGRFFARNGWGEIKSHFIGEVSHYASWYHFGCITPCRLISNYPAWPRSCLLNQHELISEREACGVFGVRPGITGLAQIQGIEMSTPGLLAITDAKMLKNMNVFVYFRYIILTMIRKAAGDRAREIASWSEIVELMPNTTLGLIPCFSRVSLSQWYH